MESLSSVSLAPTLIMRLIDVSSMICEPLEIEDVISLEVPYQTINGAQDMGISSKVTIEIHSTSSYVLTAGGFTPEEAYQDVSEMKISDVIAMYRRNQYVHSYCISQIKSHDLTSEGDLRMYGEVIAYLPYAVLPNLGRLR